MEALTASPQSVDLIPVEEREAIESRKRKGLIGPLSPERETGPFMLYCCGDDLDAIALKTNFPKEILYVTAVHYDWTKKSEGLRDGTQAFNPLNIQKDLAHSLLVATSLAVKEQLKDVLSGRKSASQCPLIPKNMQSLEKLMTLITALNTAPEASAGKGGTVVHAQNVQINQSGQSQEKSGIVEVSEEEMEAKRQEREAKYKALKGNV